MTSTLMLAIVGASSLIVGVLLGLWLAAGMRRRAIEAIVRRVGPVLERRATALGATVIPASAVDVGNDGELSVLERDSLTHVMHLADVIDEHERAQLGFLDTMRVSKEDVEESVRLKRSAKG